MTSHRRSSGLLRRSGTGSASTFCPSTMPMSPSGCWKSRRPCLGKFFPFYVTANEVRCSDDIPDQYHLFRVFNMGREPQIYILHGSQ